MKGNYTFSKCVDDLLAVRDHPQMKGNYTMSPNFSLCTSVRDHPQMKGNCTLQAPALAVLTGLLQAAMEKLLPTYNRLGNLLARWTHHKSQHMYWR